jgi:hypothetical protein
MAKETAQEKKVREAKARKAARRKERRAAAAEAKAAPQVQQMGEGVDPDPLRQLEHQIGRLSHALSQLREVADQVRPSKPLGVEQLHRRVEYTVFDKDGIRIGGAQHDLSFEDALTLTVSGSETTAHVDTGGR